MVNESQAVRPLAPDSFCKEASELLERTQAQSRRVISRLEEACESPEKFRLFVVLEDVIVVGAICYEVSSSYICAAGSVSRDAAEQLLFFLRDEFGEDFPAPRGCDGPPSAVDAISRACAEAFGCAAREIDLMETMILDTEPRRVPGIPGVLKPLAPRSKFLPLLAMWFEQFEKDTDNVSFSLGGRQQVVSHLSGAAGRRDLFVWEVKEKPVAMAIMGRTHPKQLLCVYTVPHQRGKGYGQALTAAVCAEQWQATQGKEPIILSAVPKFGAARVYERVGFRSAGWLNGVVFEESVCRTSSEVSDFASFLELETDFAKLFAASNSPIACL